MNGVNYQAARERYRNGPDREDIRMKLEAYREAGISFYRDGGDRYGACEYAKTIAAEYGIDLRIPVFAIYQQGGYGGIVGKPFDTIRDYHALVKEVRNRRGDFIKIMCSGILDFSQGKLKGTAPDASLIIEMIRIAHEEGFSVMAHVNGKRTVLETVLAGADSVEHGFGIDRECLEMMAGKGTIWVPTISTVRNLIGRGRYPDNVLSRIADAHAEAIRKAWDLKVQVAPGSDAGASCVPHVKGIRDEAAHIADALCRQAREECVREWLRSGEEAVKRKFMSQP